MTRVPAAPAALRTSHAVTVLATVAVVYALWWAQSIVVPLVVSVLLALVLSPAVRALERWRLPRVVGASLVMAAVLGAATAALGLLLDPAADWLARAPQTIDRLAQRVAEWRRPIEAATTATDKLLGSEATPTAAAPAGGASAMLTEVIAQAPGLVATLLATVFLVFLLLLHGDRVLRKAVTLVPDLQDKKDLVAGTREAQHELSRYLLTVTAINLALGAATAFGLWLIDTPDAVLWGGIAGLLNYAPYVGAAVTCALLLLVGLGEHSGLAALAPTGVFLALNLVEGQLVTPLLVGRQLDLDPVLILVGLLVLGWLWGVVGLLIAVPLLTCLKIVAQRFASDGVWATLLTDRTG